MPDGLFGVVLELIIDAAPVDGRVHAGLDVGDEVHMRLAVGDLHVGKQTGGVDGRGNLADAAALGFLALAAGGIDGRGLIALLLRAFADDAVERELLAGIQDRAVDGLAGQLEIGGTVGVCRVRRIALAEDVGEEFLFPVFSA